MDLHTMTRRIIHGTDHMPARDGLLRVAVILFGAAVTLTITDPWFGFLAGTITAVAGVTTLWELHDTAIECETTDEDEDQADETGFGTAA